MLYVTNGWRSLGLETRQPIVGDRIDTELCVLRNLDLISGSPFAATIS